MNKDTSSKTFEEFKAKGSEVKEKIKDIVEEGNARRIIIKKGEKTLFEIPLAVGLGGAAAAVWLSAPLAAVGAIAAMATDVRIIVERIKTAPSTEVIEPTAEEEG